MEYNQLKDSYDSKAIQKYSCGRWQQRLSWKWKSSPEITCHLKPWHWRDGRSVIKHVHPSWCQLLWNGSCFVTASIKKKTSYKKPWCAKWPQIYHEHYLFFDISTITTSTPIIYCQTKFTLKGLSSTKQTILHHILK